MIRRLKSKKAFTLVEVIIVLVILAILAAVLIPSFSGYIDSANEKKMLTEARQWLTAAQTGISKFYAENKQLFDYKYVHESTTKFYVTDIDENGKEVKRYQKAVRISNSYLYDAQNGKITPKTKGFGDVAVYTMKFMESADKKTATTVFKGSGVLGANDSTATAEGYFKAYPNEEIAVCFFFDNHAKLLMLQYARKDFPKILEVYSSGYAFVDKVTTSAQGKTN